ncbi:hypothetical protein AB4Y63_07280 [Leifsonia sp. YAF41]|uniref:hypothetical protein n=1 Tax=Leifsonia sp. YAF41 TaxID=3233086 RepID=UPI003F9BC35D
MLNTLELLQTTEGPGLLLTWGPFAIQIGNLIVITVMIVLFVLALLLPFPNGRRRK